MKKNKKIWSIDDFHECSWWVSLMVAFNFAKYPYLELDLYERTEA